MFVVAYVKKEKWEIEDTLKKIIAGGCIHKNRM